MKDSSTVDYPKGVALSGSSKARLGKIQHLTRTVLESILEGNFRGVNGNTTKASNMFRKGSDLVKSHHVLGLRLGEDKSRLSVLVGAVVIATYRRGCYHVCAEYCPGTQKLLGWYCTCFAGNAKCIHLAAVFFALARYQEQPIRDFHGEAPIGFSGGDTIAQFSRDTVKDTLSWVEACRFLRSHPPHVLVHNLVLEQKTFVELKELCELIRRWRMGKKGKRGPSSYAAQIEKLSIAQILDFAREREVGLEALIEEAESAGHVNAGTDKQWMRKQILICLAEREDPDDPDCEGAAEQLELDLCPCDDERGGTADGDVECPSCRQWWHHDCVGLQSKLEMKSFKKCPTCVAFLGKVAELQKQKKFGLFSNDWDDLHK